MSHAASATGRDDSGAKPKAGLFDIRTFIGALLGIYGVVLLLVGIFGTSDADLEKAAGINVNLWTGIALVVAGVLFESWKRLRPVKVTEDVHETDAQAADSRQG